jgi:dissimilatory sulfite reductase (desulfoviridin) alpha/beta subunit
VIFIVVKNRISPTSVDSVRESLDRALDRGTQAYRWGELVDRHGRERWLEPLMNEVAPYLQLQMGDLAADLEILRK